MNKEISTNPKAIREALEAAGSKIGSVHFRKRSDGSLRKMCYRLHVQNPSIAAKPRSSTINKRQRDLENGQMTVFDVNKVVRKNGEVLGRGAFRTVPLENVVRICNNGTIYKIKGRG